jgi:hypothetical protein
MVLREKGRRGRSTIHDGIKGAFVHLYRGSAFGWAIRQSGSSALQRIPDQRAVIDAPLQVSRWSERVVHKGGRSARLCNGPGSIRLRSARGAAFTSLTMTYRPGVVSAVSRVVAWDLGIVGRGSAIVVDQVVSRRA